MQALILCGGLGKRLRPFTKKTPKSMMPIAGKPFLEYLIEFLKKNGIKEMILCTGYLHNKIEDYFGSGRQFGMNIRYSHEHSPLGTGGAIKNAEKLIRSRFFVLNGDSYINLNLKSLLAKHLQNKAIVTIALTKVKDVSRYGQVTVDKKGKIIDFQEKANLKYKKGGYINAGIYLLENKTLKMIPPKINCSLEKDIFPKLIEAVQECHCEEFPMKSERRTVRSLAMTEMTKEKVIEQPLIGQRFYGYKYKGLFIDIGIPRSYREFNKLMQRKTV